jgi:hypothetical protein
VSFDLSDFRNNRPFDRNLDRDRDVCAVNGTRVPFTRNSKPCRDTPGGTTKWYDRRSCAPPPAQPPQPPAPDPPAARPAAAADPGAIPATAAVAAPSNPDRNNHRRPTGVANNSAIVS